MIRPESGRVSARRLTRADYHSTTRDLFGIDIRPADASRETAAYRFDNISDERNR